MGLSYHFYRMHIVCAVLRGGLTCTSSMRQTMGSPILEIAAANLLIRNVSLRLPVSEKTSSLSCIFPSPSSSCSDVPSKCCTRWALSCSPTGHRSQKMVRNVGIASTRSLLSSSFTSSSNLSTTSFHVSLLRCLATEQYSSRADEIPE